MKPKDMFKVLDLARNARKQGRKYNVCFSGAPGIAKSEIVQQWTKQKYLSFIDLRGAYLESPDLIGFPSIVLKDGRQITMHNTPDFWPQDGEGVLFIDEINRSTTAVLNTFMQLLTDRKVHKYSLPEGWMIVSAINPENETNDVNTMDTALKDRFAIYEVKYDREGFIDYMRSSQWHEDVISFVETGTFKYVDPQNVGDVAGAKYVSPRTLEMLSTALLSGLDTLGDDVELATYESVLGRNIAMGFYSFRKNETPVSYNDIIKTWSKAKSRLKKFSDPKNYRQAQISLTIRDIVDRYDEKEMNWEKLGQVILAIPADQSTVLITDLSFKLKREGDFLDDLIKNVPDVKNYLQDNLKAV